MRYASPVSVTGSLPRPELAVECPIRLCGPHCSCAACGSGHGVTEARIAAIPGGRWTVMARSAWLPSGRLIVRVNGVNAPAWLSMEPAWKPGSNGSGFEQPEPFGPEVMGKLARLV